MPIPPTSRFYHVLLMLVMLIATVYTAPTSDVVNFFSLVINMTAYPPENTTAFVESLALALGAQTGTVFVISTRNLTAAEQATIDAQFHVNNVSCQQINLTFVGNLGDALESSSALTSMLQLGEGSQIGILAISTAPPTLRNWNATLTLNVTLAPSVTAETFETNVMELFQITSDSFVIGASLGTTADGRDIANVTLVGSHTSTIWSMLARLSSAEILQSLGAEHLSLNRMAAPSTTSAPTGDGNGVSENRPVIIVCAVLGGLVVSALLMAFLHHHRNSRNSHVHPMNFSARKSVFEKSTIQVGVPSPSGSLNAPNPMV